MIRTVIAIGTLVIWSAADARAEVYECDGKWTNKPCSGEITRSIEESGSNAPVDPQVKAIRDKTSLLHGLRMSAIRARERFGLDVDLTDVEDFCLKQPTSPEGCRDKVNERQVELDQRVAAASTVAANERGVALQEEANRIQEERNQIEANKPNITVIEEERAPYIVVPRREIIGGSGASISVSGSNANGSIGIEASTGTTTGIVGGSPVVVLPDTGIRPRPDRGVVLYDRHGNPRRVEGVKPGPFTPKKSPTDHDQHHKCR